MGGGCRAGVFWVTSCGRLTDTPNAGAIHSGHSFLVMVLAKGRTVQTGLWRLAMGLYKQVHPFTSVICCPVHCW
jgi:hypothetical protein